MPWHCTVHYEPNYVETCFFGSMSSSELGEAFQHILELATKEDIPEILADLSQLTGGHSVVDLYYLIGTLEGTEVGRRMREAIIIPALPLSPENAEFWETACLNRGLRVSLFKDRQSALDWLFPADLRTLPAQGFSA